MSVINYDNLTKDQNVLPIKLEMVSLYLIRPKYVNSFKKVLNPIYRFIYSHSIPPQTVN